MQVRDSVIIIFAEQRRHGDKSIEYGTYLLVGLIEKLIPLLTS